MKNHSMDDMKPYLDLSSKDFPDVAKWEVGKTYDLNLKVKMTRKSQGGYGVPDSLISGGFEVITSDKASQEKVKPKDKSEYKMVSKKYEKTPSPSTFIRAAKKVS